MESKNITNDINLYFNEMKKDKQNKKIRFFNKDEFEKIIEKLFKNINHNIVDIMEFTDEIIVDFEIKIKKWYIKDFLYNTYLVNYMFILNKNLNSIIIRILDDDE